MPPYSRTERISYADPVRQEWGWGVLDLFQAYSYAIVHTQCAFLFSTIIAKSYSCLKILFLENRTSLSVHIAGAVWGNWWLKSVCFFFILVAKVTKTVLYQLLNVNSSSLEIWKENKVQKSLWLKSQNLV